MSKKILVILIVIFSGIIGWKLIKPNEESVIQSHRSYEIEITSNTSDIKPKQKATIQYRIKNDKREILRDFETVHEKIMHFIVVRKDLTNFQHLHPVFDTGTGEFSVDVDLPEAGPYRLFPDFTPGVENPQKLPVTVYQDIDVGDSSKYYARSVVPDNEQTKTYGDYKITTRFPKDAKKQTEITYSLNISQNGNPVTNLENYLGALGHSVIIKESTLDFIHTHSGDMVMDEEMMREMGHSTEDIQFTTTFPEAGIYEIFTQFQHEGKVLTVEYTIKVD